MSSDVKLSDVAQLVMGQSPPSISYNETGQGLPFYQGKSEFGATYPTPRIYCTEPKKLAEAGDILMSVRAPVGATNLCREKSCIGRGIAAIRAKGIDRDFLYFYLRKIEDYIDSLGSGAIFKAINKSQMSELPINEAGIELPEQKKIAHILSTVQRAIEVQERIIQTTTELKKTLMQKLFTEGLRGEPQKETESGPVPESWWMLKLGTLFDKEPQNGLYKPKKDYGTGTQILRIDGFSNNGDVVQRASNRVALSEKEIATYGLEVGDIVINRVNSLSHLGKTALIGAIGESMVFESNMMRFSVDESKAKKEFVFKFLNSTFAKKQIIGSAKRAVAQSSINQGDVKAILIPTPSLEEQAKIARILETTEQKIANAVQKKTVLYDLFCTLLHELMTANIRVHELEIETMEERIHA